MLFDYPLVFTGTIRPSSHSNEFGRNYFAPESLLIQDLSFSASRDLHPRFETVFLKSWGHSRGGVFVSKMKVSNITVHTQNMPIFISEHQQSSVHGQGNFTR